MTTPPRTPHNIRSFSTAANQGKIRPFNVAGAERASSSILFGTFEIATFHMFTPRRATASHRYNQI
jgi:hypothetical protein